MKKTPCSSRPQAPRAESPGMLRRISKSFSLLPVLVLLMVMAFVPTVSALACSKDSQCRRDVCIFSNCATRAGSGGTCQANTHCFNAATQSCINFKCLDKSATGEVCDDFADCLISGSVCPSGKCLAPLDSSCSLNSDCAPSLACINTFCSIKSPTGGDCDEPDDCAKSGDVCTGGKCETPFVPALMVWDGNQASSSNHGSGAGVVVNGLFYVVAGNNAQSVEVFDPLTNTWTTKADAPVACNSHAVVAVGSSVFVIGGLVLGTFSTTFYRYDTVSNTWDQNWPQLPEGKAKVAAAVVGTTVFLFGGQATGPVTRDTILSFDTSDNKNVWVTYPNAKLPLAASGLSATTVKNEIFLTGGVPAVGAAYSSALKYNTDTPDVSPISISSMTQARSFHMSFYDPTHKLLYVVGGVSSSYENTVEVLDLSVSSAGSWSSANAPNYINIQSGYGGLIGSRFHSVSFQILQVLDVSVPASVKWTPFSNSPSPSASVFQMTKPNTITAVDTAIQKTSFYNTVSNTWTVGPFNSLGATTYGSASAVVNGELYVMGGTGTVLASSSVFALNAAGDTWAAKDPLPSGKLGGCAAADGTDIYFYGGSGRLVFPPTNTLYLMDTTKPANSQWSTVAPAGATPTAVTSCAAVVVGRKLLIFGGGTSSNGATPTGLIQSFDITTKTWDSALTATITARSRLSAVFLKGFVFVIGGSSDGNGISLPKTEVFEVSTQKVSAIKDMPTPRFSLGSVTDGTSVFSVGGQVGTATFPSLEKLHSP